MAAVGIGLALAEAGTTLAAGVAAAALAVLWAIRAATLGAIAAALVLCGAAVGELRLASIDAPAQRLRDGERVELQAHLVTPPRRGPFGSSAEVAVTGGPLEGARLLVRAARWAPLPNAVGIGQELQLEGRVKALTSRADASTRDASFDFAAYLRARGVAGELLLEHARRTGRRRDGLAAALDWMRERAERAVVAGMSSADGALLRGMVLGQDEAIDEALRQDFRDSGLAHLLAVSGQNVMLLAALALPALALTGLGLRGRLTALVALIALYVPLAGAGPSLQRAGVMGIAGIAAMVASRPASRSYALLLAAAATLAWNPRSWTDPGWQLSFAAVAGILVTGVPLSRSLRRIGDDLVQPKWKPASGDAAARTVSARALAVGAVRVLADGVAITVSATLATAPLLAHHFGSVPLAGLLANLLALPAVAPAMWLGMLKIGLGQLGDLGLTAAEALGRVTAVPVGYIASLAERCADLPSGQLALGLDSPAALIAAYVVLAAAALPAAGLARPLAARFPERAARWRRLPRARRLAVATTAALALLASAAPALQGPAPPGRLTVRFLDVGQGDATLIQHPDGAAVLFDGGPPEGGVTRLLRKAGVDRLSVVVATHASRDHHGGLVEVLRRYPVGTLLDGGDGTSDPGFRAVLDEAATQGLRRVVAAAPLTLTLAGGDLRIRLLSPLPRPPGPPPEDPNPRAVVALVTAGAFDLLLTADAESETLLPLDLPDVDAVKVPHHGSADPGLPDVLDQAEPELAAIEVGPNTYGHPAPSTLTALSRADVTTYRTDLHGTVTLTVDEGEMRVDTER
ncbi:MAG TPA: ComEC/Rec2 family competence protein [Thermoleophilaceae bacterium]|nr:ComEC/Rec2 family competence protein [Thermoleophilaceae bacterium]